MRILRTFDAILRCTPSGSSKTFHLSSAKVRRQNRQHCWLGRPGYSISMSQYLQRFLLRPRWSQRIQNGAHKHLHPLTELRFRRLMESVLVESVLVEAALVNWTWSKSYPAGRDLVFHTQGKTFLDIVAARDRFRCNSNTSCEASSRDMSSDSLA